MSSFYGGRPGSTGPKGDSVKKILIKNKSENGVPLDYPENGLTENYFAYEIKTYNEFEDGISTLHYLGDYPQDSSHFLIADTEADITQSKKEALKIGGIWLVLEKNPLQ